MSRLKNYPPTHTHLLMTLAVTRSRYGILIVHCFLLLSLCARFLCFSRFAFSSIHRVRIVYEPVHEISNNVVCATSTASDQSAHTRSLIRAFASCLSIL